MGEVNCAAWGTQRQAAIAGRSQRGAPRVSSRQSAVGKCRMANSIWPSGSCRHFSMIGSKPLRGDWPIISRALHRAASMGSVNISIWWWDIRSAKSRGRTSMSELQHWSIQAVALHPTVGLVIAINQADLSPLFGIAANEGMRLSLRKLGVHPQAAMPVSRQNG